MGVRMRLNGVGDGVRPLAWTQTSRPPRVRKGSDAAACTDAFIAALLAVSAQARDQRRSDLGAQGSGRVAARRTQRHRCGGWLRRGAGGRGAPADLSFRGSSNPAYMKIAYPMAMSPPTWGVVHGRGGARLPGAGHRPAGARAQVRRRLRRHQYRPSPRRGAAPLLRPRRHQPAITANAGATTSRRHRHLLHAERLASPRRTSPSSPPRRQRRACR